MKVILYQNFFRRDSFEHMAQLSNKIMDAPFDLSFWLSSLMELSGLMTSQTQTQTVLDIYT